MAQYQQTTITLTQAKTLVAQTGAGSAQTSELDLAEDAIQEAVRRWSRYHDWSYLLKSEELSIVAGTSSYDVAADVKRPYSVRLQTTRRALTYVEQRWWDRVRADHTSQATPLFYTLSKLGSANQITLLPVPAVTETATHYYYRPILVTTDGGTALDIVDHHLDALLDMARGTFHAMRGAMRQAEFWTRKGERGMALARADDWKLPDVSEGFMPAADYDLPRLSPNDTRWW